MVVKCWVDCPTSLLSWTFPFCRSQAKKDGAEDDIAKYDGAWAVEPLAKVTPKIVVSSDRSSSVYPDLLTL